MESKKTDLSLLARLRGAMQGARAGFEGEFFPAGEPDPIVAPAGTPARAFDFPTFINRTHKQREVDGGLSFAQLRYVAEACTILRVIIEACKDEQDKVKWSWRVRPKPGEKPQELRARNDADERVRYLENLFRFPDGENDFSGWTRAIMEDHLVIDAIALEPRMTFSDKLVGLDVIDGATITRLLDDTGRTPQPLGPGGERQAAYIQYIQGQPAKDFTSEELLYFRRNVRSHKAYGYSPVEQTIMMVNTALRRALFQLSHYTEGNVGTGFVPVPEQWDLNDIKEAQEWWDAMMAGNPTEQAKMHFIPYGQTPFFPQNEVLKDEFDEWIARIFCAALKMSPDPFIKSQNRATTEATYEQAQENGMMIRAKFMKNLMERAVVLKTGWTDLEVHPRFDRAIDSLKAAQTDEIYIRIGAKSIDEVREELGYQPIGVEWGVSTGSGFIPFVKGEEEYEGKMVALLPKPEPPSQRGTGMNDSGRPGVKEGERKPDAKKVT